jgi:hypothetical protein
MHKLYDLRFVIGLFFLAIGIILIVNYLFTTQKAAVNIWCGGLFIIFGGGMVGLSAVNKDESE